MTKENNDTLANLIKNKPYKRANFNEILFEDETFCNVPIHMVDDIIALLNGAYIEGVTKSFSILTENDIVE